MTTLEDGPSLFCAASKASFLADHRERFQEYLADRDDTIRRCYAAGNATLQQLANATGLSKQRIHMIVREGEA